MTTLTLEPTAVTVAVGEGEITFETGRLAKQASGAVWVKAGGTTVLATATGATKAREGTDFFPLTVDVEEKMYAAGKIPGGFFKREGRSGEKAILTARMIDRPIRPLWPKGYRADVHCIATVMSTDMENAHDILAINGVSAALMVSPLPFFGPVGAVRVGLIDGEIVVNPSMSAMLESSLDLIVCGSPAAITMVEAGADVVPEDLLVTALEKAHVAIKLICAAQIELAEKVGKPKWTSLEQIDDMRGRYFGRIEEAISQNGLAAAADFVNTTLVGDAAPSITMDSTEEDINQRVSSTMTLGILLGEAQGNSVKNVILDQFGDRILQFSNAEGDSKELKAAKKALLMS
ncbi:MAG: hypothetical protein H7123_01230, partial [Thermoleophilia bacterium]|nr:hypothetical protein [Thermoleophilia bacterium]